MKEELLRQFSSIVELGKEGLLRGVDILQQQAPILIEQLLAWKFCTSFVSFVSKDIKFLA